MKNIIPFIKKNYMSPDGRLGGMHYLLLILIEIFCIGIAMLMASYAEQFPSFLPWIMTLVSFFIFIFGISFALLGSIDLNAKRCHDLGKSGWFQLIILIPYIGNLYLLLKSGNKSENEYGPIPNQEFFNT